MGLINIDGLSADMILMLHCIDKVPEIVAVNLSQFDLLVHISDRDLRQHMYELRKLGLITVDALRSKTGGDWKLSYLSTTPQGMRWLEHNQELLQAALNGTLLDESDKFHIGKRRRLSSLAQPRPESPDINI